MNKGKLLLLFSLLFLKQTFSQSLQPTVIASDGEYFTTSSGSLSWTMGEVITETFTATNNILTQGFQQPSSLNVSVLNIQPSDAHLLIYPNPTHGDIYINLRDMPSGEYLMELTDAIGKRLFTGMSNGGATTPYYLSVADFASGIYLLSITSSSFRQSYKIINNQ